jgi:hypothetical protein
MSDLCGATEYCNAKRHGRPGQDAGSSLYNLTATADVPQDLTLAELSF